MREIAGCADSIAYRTTRPSSASPRRGPRGGALGGLRRRLVLEVGVDGVRERVPQVDVLGLLGGVLVDLGAHGRLRGTRGGRRGLGERDHRVAVLARVPGELLAGQLARAPAHVERVLEDVAAALSVGEAVEKRHGVSHRSAASASYPACGRRPAPTSTPPSSRRDLTWLNVAFLRMDKQMGRNAVLVEFWDFARINSLRTLPYLKAWHERYGDRGLRVVDGAGARLLVRARPARPTRARSRRSGSSTRSCSTPSFELWRIYGNRGWPGRYLFDRRGVLRYIHYGEGDYLECEQAIQELLLEIDDELDLPAPLEPLRPEDAPGVALEPQTADIVLPGERDRLELVRDWTDGEDYIEASDAGAGAVFEYSGGSAWAVLSGSVEPGLYEVADGTGRGRVAGTAPARGPVHAPAAASAFLISFGSMKRTSSWTTSNSETSVVPRSRKNSTRR